MDSLGGGAFGVIGIVAVAAFASYKSWGKQTPNLSRDEGNDASLMGEPANIVEIA